VKFSSYFSRQARRTAGLDICTLDASADQCLYNIAHSNRQMRFRPPTDDATIIPVRLRRNRDDGETPTNWPPVRRGPAGFAAFVEKTPVLSEEEKDAILEGLADWA
jgi:hypothetical protein